MSDRLLQETYDDLINTPPNLQDIASDVDVNGKGLNQNANRIIIMRISEPLLEPARKTSKKRGRKPKNDVHIPIEIFDNIQAILKSLDKLNPKDMDFDFAFDDQDDKIQPKTGRNTDDFFEQKSFKVDTNESLFSLMPRCLKFVNPAE